MALVKTSTLKRLVKARALRQGLIGGSPVWRAVWIAQFAYKQFAKVSKGGEAPITFDEPLKEGEVWAVVHEPEKTRKGLGKGRKFIVGPKRTKPRASTLTGLALGVVGQKIIEAPSPERINQILGEDVFEPTPLTRKQKRATAKAAKAEARLANDQKKQAAATAKASRREEKRTAKLEKAEAGAAAKLIAANALAAKKKAKRDAKAAKRSAQVDAKERKADARRQAAASKAGAKAERKAAKRATRQTPTTMEEARVEEVLIVPAETD